MLVQGERRRADRSAVNERIVFGNSRVAIGRIHDRSLKRQSVLLTAMPANKKPVQHGKSLILRHTPGHWKIPAGSTFTKRSVALSASWTPPLRFNLLTRLRRG
jgi:hypothetical protein